MLLGCTLGGAHVSHAPALFREYPCDHVAMLNVTLMNTGCPRTALHETAVQLLHLLYKRFFLDDVVVSVHDASFDKDQVR